MKEKAEMGNNEIVLFESRDGAFLVAKNAEIAKDAQNGRRGHRASRHNPVRRDHRARRQWKSSSAVSRRMTRQFTKSFCHDYLPL